VGARNAIIAVEDNKPHAIAELTRACKNTDHTIRVLRSQYPQGGEKQLVKSVLGREIPRGKLPFDAGVAIQNIGTTFAVYEAVYLNKPLIERVVTVTGSCLADPQNLIVRIGTPIRELIGSCGPVSERPAKIIVGGPMMGIAQYTDEVPVIKSTTGVVLLTNAEVKQYNEVSCIRCGACIRNCPAGLMPCLIDNAAEKHAWKEAKELGALDCVECGLCNFSCPGNRRIVQTIKRAKLEANR
jgi:electron transport complex protein RnfC